MNHLNRRQFLKTSIQVGLGAYAGARLAPWLLTSPGDSYAVGVSNELAVVKNGNAAQMVLKAVDALGGIARFVKKGQSVVVKPNIGWDRRPEQAANTSPDVVAAVVKMCLDAGASKVTVFDRTCSVARRTYRSSGIEKAASEAGAKVRHVITQKFKNMPITNGKLLKAWEFYEDALEADVLINLPIAKHHSLCLASMSMKNLMGILGGDRGALHNHFPEKITDINTVLKPHLIILDAMRVLLRNGPQGGNLSDVKTFNTIIAGTNAVSVDAYGATLFGHKPQDLEYLRVAHQRGLGELALDKLVIKEISI